MFSRILREYNYTDSTFRVLVFKAGDFGRPDNARAALEEDISDYSDYRENYQVLERSEISINNVPGELLITSYTPVAEEPEDVTGWKWSSVLLRRDIFFDYDGFVWDITMISEEGRIEADETVWEHLLETFQIID